MDYFNDLNQYTNEIKDRILLRNMRYERQQNPS